MAELINTEQQVRAGVISPPALYSRTITQTMVLTAGLPWDLTISPNIGTSCWLWGIKIALRDMTVDNGNLNLFQFRIVELKKLTVDEAVLGYNPLPIYHQTGVLWSWQFNDGFPPIDFKMAIYLSQKRIRFCSLFNRTGAGSNVAYITWHFSEG